LRQGGQNEGQLYGLEIEQQCERRLAQWTNASSSKGSVSASKQYQKSKEPVFEWNVFFDLKNAQSVIVAFDGISPLQPTYCYLKPDFLPVDMTWFDQEKIGFDPAEVTQ